MDNTFFIFPFHWKWVDNLELLIVHICEHLLLIYIVYCCSACLLDFVNYQKYESNILRSVSISPQQDKSPSNKVTASSFLSNIYLSCKLLLGLTYITTNTVIVSLHLNSRNSNECFILSHSNIVDMLFQGDLFPHTDAWNELREPYSWLWVGFDPAYTSSYINNKTKANKQTYSAIISWLVQKGKTQNGNCVISSY